ncbi:MAG: iron-sulfur cluster assembly scaffold protein [Candidatus Dojkabacteria bacterium]|nr:iron-sulfur cluster assembly scaffold protein [Candidatus Dojkabacteria bacterium]MDQ7021018.1 iron-sulfur cluster assembly scaffold protein [Candidatus Dojkabacteria bacterium]
MNEYQEQLLDHYKNPQNFDKQIEYTNKATSKNLSCGDRVTIQLDIKNDVIVDVSFNGEGCSICIGSASLLYEKIIGMKISELSKFNLDSLLELIGIELTSSRLKCASISLDAAKTAAGV